METRYKLEMSGPPENIGRVLKTIVRNVFGSDWIAIKPSIRMERNPAFVLDRLRTVRKIVRHKAHNISKSNFFKVSSSGRVTAFSVFPYFR